MRKVSEMRRHLECYVTDDMFKNRCPPAKTRRRFYPTSRDISNYMTRTRNAQTFSKVDQENLAAQIDLWQQQNPDDMIFFRPHTTTPNSENPTNEEVCVGNERKEEEKCTLLFCYQNKDQQRLLTKYANDMCLLDATYKTTKYALPLFFLCVRTNVS